METYDGILGQFTEVLNNILNGKSDKFSMFQKKDDHSNEECLFIDQFNRFLEHYQQVMDFMNKEQKQNLELLEQIHKSEQFYKMLFRIVQDDVTITDLNGNITFVSEKGLQMFGYESLDELAGVNIIELIAPDFKQKVPNTLSEIIKGNDTGISEYKLIHKYGNEFWAEVSSEILRTETGEAESLLFVVRDITQKKNMQYQLLEYAVEKEKQARTDGMTGLLNRKEGIEVLSSELKRSAYGKNTLAAMFIDIDRLKYINDNFGHAEGDRVILALTSCILNSIRGTVHTCRMGGDEFLLIIPDCDMNKLEKLIHRIDENVKKANSKYSFKIPLAFSCGFAFSKPEHPLTEEEIVKKADEEMYRQKKNKKCVIETAG